MTSLQSVSERRQRATPHRSFTLPSKLGDSSKRNEVIAQPTSDAIETLFEHPSAKIVCFNTASQRAIPRSGDSEVTSPENSPAGELSWRSDREWTMATGLVALLLHPKSPLTNCLGPLRLYRVRGSAAFLNSGKIVHPILSKSQCWCVNGESLFVLRVRGTTYWRIEFPNDSAEDKSLASDIKDSFAKVLQYETTPCPFQRTFYVELPERSPTVKRPWKPRRATTAQPLNGYSPQEQLASRFKTQGGSNVRQPGHVFDQGIDSSLGPIDKDEGALSLSFSTPLPVLATVEQHVSAYEELTALNQAQGLGVKVLHMVDTDASASSAFEAYQGPPDTLGTSQQRSLHATAVKSGSYSDLEETAERACCPNSDSGDMLNEDLPRVISQLAQEPAHGKAVPLKVGTFTARSLDSPFASHPMHNSASQPLISGPRNISTRSRLLARSVPHTQPSLRQRRTFSAERPSTCKAGTSFNAKNQAEDLETTSQSSSIDSFHSVESSVPASPHSPSSTHSSAQGSRRGRRGRTSPSTPCSRDELDRMSVSDDSDATRSSPGTLSESCAPRKAATAHGSASHLDVSDSGTLQSSSAPPGENAAVQTLALRNRFRSRRIHSPSPEPANMYLPSTRLPGSYLSSHMLQKTCNLLLGPPVQIVALMLNLATKIANGALGLRGNVFTFHTNGQPIPCSWDFVEDEAASDFGQDDYGVSLVGRMKDGISVRHIQSSDTSWDVD